MLGISTLLPRSVELRSTQPRPLYIAKHCNAPNTATRDIFQPQPPSNKEPVYLHPLENSPHICTRLQHTLPSQLDLLCKLACRPSALGPTNRYSLPKLNLVLCLFPRAGTVVRERDARERAGAKVLRAGCCLRAVSLGVYLKKKTGFKERRMKTHHSRTASDTKRCHCGRSAVAVAVAVAVAAAAAGR
jgi:hypothetical protein